MYHSVLYKLIFSKIKWHWKEFIYILPVQQANKTLETN